ncbi:MAG TPA: universal stress protein [Acidobacteriaceae bacterium]|jgi:nucleotide-binding universal stress UspA family protein|nr:universal stress protein [Acidobacteriaceae bacterium]
MTLPIHHPDTPYARPGKIVVATDLTDTDYLIPHAIAQARSSGASLVLVNAVLPHESMPVETGAVPWYDPLRMDRDARLLLENLAREVREQGVDCATAVRHGFAPDVIAEVVKNADAGRLIIGTHGRRGLKKFVLGSVARQLLDLVDIPVCTIGPRAHHLPEGAPGTILHPVSLAGLHETSTFLSLQLARQFAARVVLLHVVTPGAATARDPGKAVSAATAELNRLIPSEARASTQVMVRIALNNVVSEVLNVAQEIEARLIVLGVHALSHSWLPGTEPAAYKILVSAPCPVISLRVTPEPEKKDHQPESTPAVLS